MTRQMTGLQFLLANTETQDAGEATDRRDLLQRLATAQANAAEDRAARRRAVTCAAVIRRAARRLLEENEELREQCRTAERDTINLALVDGDTYAEIVAIHAAVTPEDVAALEFMVSQAAAADFNPAWDEVQCAIEYDDGERDEEGRITVPPGWSMEVLPETARRFVPGETTQMEGQ